MVKCTRSHHIGMKNGMKNGVGIGLGINVRVGVKSDRAKCAGSMQGFTLIEVLIAMSLTAMLGVLAAQFLGSAIDAEERSRTLLSDVNEVEQVWQLMANDLEQLALKPLSQPAIGNTALPGLEQAGMPLSLVGGKGRQSQLEMATRQSGALLLFDRHGWDNPLQQSRSDVQRVMYRMEGNTLIREYWQENQQSFSSAPDGSLYLLESVNDINIRFLPAGHVSAEQQSWVESWPSDAMIRRARGNEESEEQSEGGDGDEDPVPGILLSRPGVIAVAIDTEKLGRVHRLFALPGI